MTNKKEIRDILKKFDLQLFAESGAGGGSGSGGGSGGFSLAYVQELRDEAAGWRTKLREVEKENAELKKTTEKVEKQVTGLEDQIKTFQANVCTALSLDPEKSKPEDVFAKIKDLTSGSDSTVEKAQDALKKAAFMASAVKKGIRKEALEDAYKLADFSNVRVDLETMEVYPVDKDGKQLIDEDKNPITNLDSLAESMAKEKSWLMGKVGVGSPSSPGPGGSEEGEPESFGARLGKKQKEIAKQSTDSQSHYFK